MSNGNILLFDNGYRGDHRRHRVQDLRCEHVFYISLKELALEQADKACPFCNPVDDLRRYGSVEAIQEFVLLHSDNKIYFSSDNHLGGQEDIYTFGCSVHKMLLHDTFRNFIAKTESGGLCFACAFDKTASNLTRF